MLPALLLLAFSFGTEVIPKEDSFVESLSHDDIVSWAELCAEAYCSNLKGKCTNDEMTQHLKGKQLIEPEHKVIMQGYRNRDQLSSIVMKTGLNQFKVIFTGSESLYDVLRDIDFTSVAIDQIKVHLHKLHTDFIEVRKKKAHRKDDDDHTSSVEVEVFSGFEKAGEDFLKHFLVGLEPYLKDGHPITIAVSGHSLGGALAVQMAYYLKRQDADITPLVITFGAAGYFSEEDIEPVGKMLDAERSMVHFARKNDLARDLTAMVGYGNPGHTVMLDDYIKVKGGLKEFLLKTVKFQEGIVDIAERVYEEKENHSMANYLATLTGDHVTAEESPFHYAYLIFVALAYMYHHFLSRKEESN